MRATRHKSTQPDRTSQAPRSVLVPVAVAVAVLLLQEGATLSLSLSLSLSFFFFTASATVAVEELVGELQQLFSLLAALAVALSQEQRTERRSPDSLPLFILTGDSQVKRS